MPGPVRSSMTDADADALRRGRGEGFAIAAVALGVAAFFNLLGAEKGILAIVLGVLALRSARPGPARQQGWFAITLGVVQIVTVLIILVVFRDKLGQLLDLLKTLG